jgi:uncharacterized protein
LCAIRASRIIAPMSERAQAILHPNGITVFGSAQIQAPPTRAQIELAVTRLDPKPADAFRLAREASASVSAFFAQLGVRAADVATAQATLQQAFDGYGETRKFLGYRAVIGYRVFVVDLAKLEPILTGVVEAGADRLDRLTFHTSRQGELRNEARRRAVAAARAKAELYAHAAGVRVGPVLHIEDRNPADLRVEVGHGAAIDLTEDDTASYDIPTPPGSIVVQAAVSISYAILS